VNFSVQSIYNWYRSTLRNPKYRWWIILGSLVYLFSPFDLAPDFIPVLGLLDDTVILTLLVSEISQILATRLKSRDETTATSTTDEGATPASDTVDVKAVPIK
jgi:uncharacterized membrane protein YkvA (DUF1232 family)